MRKQSKIPGFVLFNLVFIIQFYTLCGQSNKIYPAAIESAIKQVESNLGGWVQTGTEPFHWTLPERMKFYHCNGVSIAVIKNYQIEWAKGYGWADSAEQRPVTTATLFQAGSNSKSLNAVGVLKLATEKKLDLYADINNYLTTWKFPYDSLSKGKKITLANLLSHTGGLTIHGFPGYEKGEPIPSLVQVLNGQKPANTDAVRSMYEPSLKYEYSGGGTTIAQLIVQDITGEQYDEWMWNNVLKPMGMTGSTYSQPPPADKQNLLATGYYNDGKPVKGSYHIYPEQAAAGLWTNPTDLANYVIETQLALQGKSEKVLSKEMTALRLTPYIDSAAALGIFIINKNGVKYFRHGGVDEGFVSQYIGSMEGGNGVVVMTNTYNTALFEEIINSVALTYHWKNYYTPVIKKETVLEDKKLQAFTGKYKLGQDTMTIVKKNNGLYLDVGDNIFWKIHFTDDTHFFVLERNIELNFIKDAIQKTTGFTWGNRLANKID